MSQFRDLLWRETAAFLALDDRQVQLLEDHYNLLVRWNQKMNLTAVRAQAEIVRVHYAESLFLGSLVAGLGPMSICDVGSGAGFPGFPVAVLNAGATVDLVESHQRKAVFLKESFRAVPNIKVTAGRFESLPGPWDCIVSRAVSWDSIAEHALQAGKHIALLVSAGDCERIRKSSGRSWAEPVSLPWPDRGFVLIGS